ncbi:winged helix-turn-helix transcriptional regulator [Cohnella pontilimi]|uniref:Winged helix-turn-helix transcriptional regulator n=1 Tax=Cohnella pontilimi TaxID=2564100 RepID=A0A4U0F878_9BACL|nr:carbohydrate kinase [Cohnella pontilimi]TJY40720.1 winged helix-turn-helix transcriptional regulator [Cohnella pontilimi]
MDREEQIMELIRRNPFVTQQEIAESIGISRSAVAGYIAALTKKGIIRGRAYIPSDTASVLCIGGANLDSKAAAKQPIRMASSNPVNVTQSCGGVARNIAETLARMSAKVSLMTMVGDDNAGAWVLEETKNRGVDTGSSMVMPGDKTGSYTAVIDHDGEMVLAFADMDIYDRFTPAMLRERWAHVAASKLVIADTNLPADTLAELIGRCGEHGIPLLVDPVSSEKSKKLPEKLDGITAIFPNEEEACEMTGFRYGDSHNPEKLAEALAARGVRNVFLTLGGRGVWYFGQEGSRHFPAIPTRVVEVTGAGDAFAAGIAFGMLHERGFQESCRFGIAAAHLALQTSHSVADRLNEQLLHQTVKEKFE